MRKLLLLSLCILVLSCLSEDGVAPGVATTFIRYYNGGNNDEAKGLELTTDGGYIILANTKIQKTEAEIPRTKIKLVKTDVEGNPLWQRLYPGFTDPNPNILRDYTASNVQVKPDGGYIIIGSVIETDSLSKTFVLSVDGNGVPLDSATFAFDPNIAESGKAIAIDLAGNYVALSTQGTTKLIITQLNKDTFVPVLPQRDHTQGETKLASRLLVDSNGKVIISGMETLSGTTGIRLLRTIPDSPTVDFSLLLAQQGFTLSGFDFCRYGTGYAIAGSTNQKPDGTAATDTDVMFYLTDSDGNTIRFTSFPFDDPATIENEDSQIDAGNAITSTLDGGLIFLSSINSSAIEGRGDTEFYMIKIDAFGEKIWSSSFGSRFKDEGVAIRQLNDGSYVALGTTIQGQLKILTLFKTNENGKIE